MRFVIELDGPELAASVAVECAEAVVIGRAEKHEAAGRNDRAGQAHPPRIFLALGQFVGDSRCHAPREISGVCVNGHQLSPRRLLAWPAAAHNRLSVTTCHSGVASLCWS